MSEKKLSGNANKPASRPFVNVVDRVADRVVSVVNVWAHGAGSGFDRIGNILSRSLDAFGNILNGIPLAHKILHWLATILSAGFDLLGMLIFSAINLVAIGVCGTIRILGGVVLLDGNLIRTGALDFVAGIAGMIIALGAKVIALIHALIFMQMGERPLSDHEKAVLRRVYRDSIALKDIRVIAGFAGLFSTNNRPFALGNRIYLKGIDTMKNPALFAHECCHIWQYQRYGARYIIEALWAQWTLKNAYNWEAEFERGRARWQDFNREAQAEFILDVYNDGRKISSGNTKGEFYDDDPIGEVVFKHKGKEYTDFARETIQFIRSKGSRRE